jgi:outer membrane autotransporter protein
LGRLVELFFFACSFNLYKSNMALHQGSSLRRGGLGNLRKCFRQGQRRLRRILFLAALSAGTLLPWQALSAATFTVSNANDAGAGSLRQAIADANAAGAGSHMIDFSLGANSTITLASVLPLINADVLIDGSTSSGLTVSGNNAARVFFVDSGNVQLKGMTIASGLAKGGDGGPGGGGGLGAGAAVFVNASGQLTLQNVHFANNAAVGGTGGYFGVGGGGGGGLGGDGGSSSSSAGAGGGGLYGQGGDSNVITGGGGGGGKYGNGGEGGIYAGGGGGGSTLNGQPGGFATGGAGGAPEGGKGGNHSQAGADGTIGGGGGGGGENANGGDGGVYGGGGGAGALGQGGHGGTFGGGGGVKSGSGVGGDGGFGGGGGSGGWMGGGVGGNGGFGAGGGAGASPGLGGFGGTTNQGSHTGGGGGAGFGGAIFAMAGATIIIQQDVSFTNNTVQGGDDGDLINTGAADGNNLFLMGGTTAAFDISAGHTLTFASPVGNDDGTLSGVNLVKQGDGKLIVAGSNQYVANTLVNRGTLAVNGTLSGQTTVDASGTLSGSGTIVGNVINQGVVAAGNSIGTLTINGNYSQSANATMQVEIDNAGHSDQVNVTGTAALDGSVQVLSAPATYTAGQQYVFLSAGGGVTGAFAGISDDLAFFDAELFYAGNDVGFVLVPIYPDFSNLGQNSNQRHVGAYLDNANSDPHFSDIASNFLLLTNGQAAIGLQQLGGEVFATSPQLMLQNTTLTWQNVMGRLRPQASNAGYADDLAFARRTSLQLVSRRGSSSALPLQWIDGTARSAPSRTGWVSGYGLGGVAGSNGSAVGVNYGLGGTQFGLESSLDEYTTVGAFGGYVGSQLNTATIAQQATANSGQVGSYFQRNLGRDYYLLAGGFSFDAYDSRRQLAIGPLSSTLSAEYAGWQGITYVERGLNLAAGRAEIQPYVALQYIHLRQNALQESGGTGALNIDSLDADSLRSLVGGRISRPVVTRSGQLLIPQLRATWLHEFLDTNQIANARFGAFGAGTSFAVQGLDLGRDWAMLGGGLTWEITDRLQIAGNYDLQTNNRQTFHIGSGMLTYLW